jgi:hypothetical protein
VVAARRRVTQRAKWSRLSTRKPSINALTGVGS